MKLFNTILILVLISFTLEAQEIDFDLEPNFETVEDVAAAKDNFVKAAEWLINTPYDPTSEDWKAVATYTLAWVSSTDMFSVRLTSGMLTYSEDNPGLIFVFTTAWGIHAVLNPEESDDVEACCLAAMNTLVDYAVKNSNELKRSRELKKIIRKKENEELEEWVSEIVEE